MTRGARYAAVFLFLFALALAGANLLFTSANARRVASNAATITQLCQSGNELRAQQIRLWTFVIQISRPPPHETAAQRAQREKTVRVFEAHLHQVFKPRDCQIKELS